MEILGLSPYGIGSYFHEFTYTPKSSPHLHGPGTTEKPVTGKNVVGFINHGAKTTVVIGAHYDHLGYGHEGSLHTGEKSIHNGADDNASGVAAMLNLVHFCKSDVAKNNNYLFIAFSGEEKGLRGSKSYVKNPTMPMRNINYMINMDMVGRLDSGKLAISGVGTSNTWVYALEHVMNSPCCKKPEAKDSTKQVTFESVTTKNEDWNLVLSKSGIGPSDHTSFYLENIPVLHFFTGQHSDYHKPSDDFDKVNFKGIVHISDFIASLIVYNDSKGKLDFQKTKMDKNSKAPRFKVTLGVMPDYMFQGKGMRIDGIIPDRPAEKAGIEKGDIVTKMGKVEISDMQSYMKGLGQYNPGDKAIVVIKRGEELLEIEVEF
jgi:hypothetical protein